MNKAFKLVNRAVKLNDISNHLIDTSSILFSPETRPLTPPIEADGLSSIPSQSATTRTSASSTSLSDGEAVVSKKKPKIFNFSRTASSKGRTQSALAISTGSSLQLPHFPHRPHSYQAQGSSMRYRVSYNRGNPDQRKNTLVSQELFTAHDTFLGCIGAFIGLHLHSRSSSELHLNTERSVKACHALLSLVDDLWRRDLRRSQGLWESREALRSKVSDLVYAAKEVFSKDPTDGEQLLLIDEGKQIVSAATNCVRSAADCVAKAKVIIERIGDYELESSKDFSSESNDEPQKAEAGADELYTLRSQEQRMSKISNRSKEVSNFSRTNIKIRTTPQLSQATPELVADLPQSATLRDSPSTQTDAKSSADPSHPLFSSSSLASTDDVCPISNIPEAEEPMDLNKQPVPSSRRTSDSHDDNTVSTKSCAESMHDVGSSEMSSASTRATSPDSKYTNTRVDGQLASSFSSASDFQYLRTDNHSDLEDQFPGKSYCHELVYSKDGQIAGGTLPALVEQLTTHDSTPDATFVNAFYLTFRLFTTPMEFAKALIDRYNYIGEYPAFATPVRLRVYNVMKGWMESHWNNEADSLVLDTVKDFAIEKLCKVWPAAASRLTELTSKLANAFPGSIVLRCPTALGRRTLESGNGHANDSNVPNPVVSRAQLSTLRNFRNNGSVCSILAFDPLELARQFTIIESRIFCSIQPEELLALEWTKKTDSKAMNVRAMSTLSTDLANLVADTILQPTEAKRRAIVIKQWVKIAMNCLDLNNYDSLMAIICSLNSSMILRLKRTWDAVSAKTKNRLEELRSIVDVGRNYAVLRQRLQNHVAPCIPFVGIYLTDLTFVDVGNQTTRQLRGQNSASAGEGTEGDNKDHGSSGRGLEVINFDKHMRTAKIIGQLQRFQIPHRLAPVPEMQEWMDYQIMRVRNSEQANVQSYYRRSLLLEPREPAPISTQSQDQSQTKTTSPTLTVAPAAVVPTTGGTSAAVGNLFATAVVASAPSKDGSKLERFGLQFLSSNAFKEKSGS